MEQRDGLGRLDRDDPDHGDFLVAVGLRGGRPLPWRPGHPLRPPAVARARSDANSGRTVRARRDRRRRIPRPPTGVAPRSLTNPSNLEEGSLPEINPRSLIVGSTGAVGLTPLGGLAGCSLSGSTVSAT